MPNGNTDAHIDVLLCQINDQTGFGGETIQPTEQVPGKHTHIQPQGAMEAPVRIGASGGLQICPCSNFEPMWNRFSLESETKSDGWIFS